MNQKILLIGGSGLIGSYFNKLVNGRLPVVGTYLHKPFDGGISCDVRDPVEIRFLFNQVEPCVVIYGANFGGGVLRCEKEKKEAVALHVEGVVNVAQECLSRDAFFIFISTECVFDGRKNKSYVEEDECNPLNVYGDLKLRAERWIVTHLKKYSIVRTVSVFGWQPETNTPNALMKTYFSLQNHQVVEVSVDRWSQPTYAGSLAQALLAVAQAKVTGIFHFSGKTFINRYEWLRYCCEKLGWDAKLIIPRSGAEDCYIQYPKRVRFDTTKFSTAFPQVPILSLEDSVKAIYDEIQKGVLPS